MSYKTSKENTFYIRHHIPLKLILFLIPLVPMIIVMTKGLISFGIWKVSSFGDFFATFFLLILILLFIYLAYRIIYEFFKGFEISISKEGLKKEKKVLLNLKDIRDFEVYGNRITIFSKKDEKLSYTYNFRGEIVRATREFEKLIPLKGSYEEKIFFAKSKQLLKNNFALYVFGLFFSILIIGYTIAEFSNTIEIIKDLSATSSNEDFPYLLTGLTFVLMCFLFAISFFKHFFKGYKLITSKQGIKIGKKFIVNFSDISHFKVIGTKIEFVTHLPGKNPIYDFNGRVNEARKEFKKYLKESK